MPGNCVRWIHSPSNSIRRTGQYEGLSIDYDVIAAQIVALDLKPGVYSDAKVPVEFI